MIDNKSDVENDDGDDNNNSITTDDCTAWKVSYLKKSHDKDHDDLTLDPRNGSAFYFVLGVTVWKLDNINNNVLRLALRTYQFADAVTAESSCFIIFTSAKNLSNPMALRQTSDFVGLYDLRVPFILLTRSGVFFE